MLKFQLMTERDRQEAAALERRQAKEEERKKRIFNPRARLIGIDYEALDKQLEEKKQRLAEEKRIDAMFQDQMEKNGQLALALAVKEKEERMRVQQDINRYRQNYQKFEDRREYDLNDKQFLKKSLPARLRDDDPRLTISSAQKFEGEDVLNEERSRVMRDQFKAYLDQQVEEKDQTKKEFKAADDAYKAAVIARDQRAIQLDNMEKDCRTRLDRACSKFNRALADERETDEKERDRHEREDKFAQMYNVMTSDMMTENPDVSLSNLGRDRRIGYLYKGMTPEQQLAVRTVQLAQIEEGKKKKAEETRVQREWDDYVNGMQRTVAIMDREADRKKKEMSKQLAEENQRMAAEHKNYIEYLNKIVYSNKPTAAFYEQFNKGTR